MTKRNGRNQQGIELVPARRSNAAETQSCHATTLAVGTPVMQQWATCANLSLIITGIASEDIILGGRDADMLWQHISVDVSIIAGIRHQATMNRAEAWSVAIVLLNMLTSCKVLASGGASRNGQG